MKCVLKYPKKENTKRPEPTNNFDSGRILSINSSLIIQKWHYFRSYFPVLAPLGSLFETSYFIFTFSFLGKQLIISLLEKKLSGLPSQSQLSQLFLRGLCVFIFSIFIILYIYYNYIYIKQLYNNIVKKKEQKRKLEPLLKITETTETETLFSPQSAFLSQAVGLFSAAIPRALVGRGWLLNSLRR